MPRLLWKPSIDSSDHIVELDHGFWSGRREIYVDGELVYKGRRLIDFGSKHTFSIRGYDCLLVIGISPFVFSYGLWIDNVLVPLSSEGDFFSSIVNRIVGRRSIQGFKPRTLGDYLALASYILGLVSCAILGIQLLLVVAGSVLGLLMLHFISLYFLPGALAVTAGAIATLLHSHQQEAKMSWALKGIALGSPMLLLFAFFWVVIAPAISQAL